MNSKKSAVPPLQSKVPGAESAPFSLRPLILLAEDNHVNRLIAREMLELLGYEVDVAINGTEAVAAARQRTHSLIFMDCQMPELDGYEASRQIRNDESERGLARVPIVALTGNTAEEEREKCLTAGMDDHLCKPFTMGQMKGICAKWIKT